MVGMYSGAAALEISVVVVQKTTTQPWPAWLSWSECRPVDWRVEGLIPGQGAGLGFKISHWLGCVREASDPRVSLTSTFLSPPALCLSNQF